MHGALAQGPLAAGFLLPGKGLTQAVACVVVQRGWRCGQQIKGRCITGNLALCAFNFSVALGQAVHGCLMGRCRRAHFPALTFQIFAGKERAVGGADAVACPVWPQARKLAAQVFLRAQQSFFLRGQGSQCLTETAFALGHAAQGGQGIQQRSVDFNGVAALTQAAEFFHLRGPLAFAAFAGFLRAGQPLLAVFRKGRADWVEALKARTGHAPFVPLQPDAKTALEHAAFFFKLHLAVAQTGEGLAFFGKVHGHAVVARAFLL